MIYRLTATDFGRGLPDVQFTFRELIEGEDNSINLCMDELSMNPNIPIGLLTSPMANTRFLSANPSQNAMWLKMKYPVSIDWNMMSLNHTAIPVLRDNMDLVNWKYLSFNPKAIDLLSANIDKVDSYMISLNVGAVDLLKANPHLIHWCAISRNPSAIELIESNLEKVDWDMLSLNPNAIHLLLANKEKINWSNLSMNPNAIGLLKSNLDKIDKKAMAGNPDIDILKEFNISVDSRLACANPAALNLLSSEFIKFSARIQKYYGFLNFGKYQFADNVPGFNKSVILEYMRSQCESAYEHKINTIKDIVNTGYHSLIWGYYDYPKLKNLKADLHRELLHELYHPARIEKWIVNGNDVIDYLP